MKHSITLCAAAIGAAAALSAAPAVAAPMFTGVASASDVATETFTAFTAEWAWETDGEITSAFALTTDMAFSVVLDFYEPGDEESLLTLLFVDPVTGDSEPVDDGTFVASADAVGAILFSADVPGDYLVVLSEGGQPSGDVQISLQAVPVPASALLLVGAASALAGVGARRRRRAG